MRVLITCPPMLRMISELRPIMDDLGWKLHCPEVVQTLTEQELIALLPGFDGWILGDDPASEPVLKAGRAGALRAVVKWGVGVDNVDFEAARALGLEVTNTPGVFGREVADVAMGYVAALARALVPIHEATLRGEWVKTRGVSLWSQTMGLVGFGDIGRNVARRARAADMKVIAYDPYFEPAVGMDVACAQWGERFDEIDFLVLTCPLTASNHHMVNAATLAKMKSGVRIVNVARGPLVDETALADALESGHVAAAALDVFEVEPLPMDSRLRRFDQNIYGSHNGSNTEQGVRFTSERAIKLLKAQFDG